MIKRTMFPKAVSLVFCGVVLLGLNEEQCDGTDPISTGCANTASTIDARYLSAGSTAYALLELRYSSECRSAWARITNLSSLACAPGADACGHATIVRDTDGVSYSCGTPAGVGTSCYTPQVNDANVTSHAEGHFDNGPNTYYAQTISYRTALR